MDLLVELRCVPRLDPRMYPRALVGGVRGREIRIFTSFNDGDQERMQVLGGIAASNPSLRVPVSWRSILK